MTTSEIRRAFLDYFVRNGHKELPSSSLVPYEDDATVLLTIAGMQPLKSYFLGTADPPAPRLTSAQKCFRTLDIDQVGHTARHLTFFEMLGNFSIGDYFKQDAIAFAWELSTEVLNLDPAHIWITVFEGMEGVPGDDEAVERWVEVGVPRERIQALGEADNFWKAGPTGPCGPNTELYLDRGESFGPAGGPVVGGDRFLEFWNLVFMQYDRAEDGTLNSLPAKNIDTGAGLERIAAILQGVPSVYETDAFRPLIEWVEGASGHRYGADARTDRALRVMADHGRGMSFLAADGVRPGNEGRGYVMRRIVRRAVSEAGRLGLRPDQVADLTDVVVAGWGEAYPGLRERSAEIRDVVGAEAEQFARTLEQGRRLLAEVLERSRGAGRVSGDDAFRLYDTYGFPLDLTSEAATDAGLDIDVGAFERLMQGQRERSRGTGAQTVDRARDLAAEVAADAPQTEFVGYDLLDVETEVTAVRGIDDGQALVKVDRSPFYPKGGGQVSDGGWLEGEAGRVEVVEVHRLGDDQVLQVTGGAVPSVGATVAAHVNAPIRRATQANHTATHVLNWALRTRLGDGVRQAGSYVGPDKLRFDFTHQGKVPADEITTIEYLVNERIREDAAVTWREMPRDRAAAEGAIGLFEEKYGERVRVLSTGDYSRELCGGTHVAHTGEIGSFKIVSEGSTGAGARRIEALTGPEAVEWMRRRAEQLEADVTARDARIVELEADLKRARSATVDIGELVEAAEDVGPIRAVVREVEAAEMDELLAIADQLRARLGDGATIVLGARGDEKAMIVGNLGPTAVAAGLSAAALVGSAAPLVGGGGGGKPAMARAGGKRPEGLPEALIAARSAIDRGLEGNGGA